MNKQPKRTACPRDPPCRGMGGVPLSVLWMHGPQKSSFMPAVHRHVEIQYVRQGFGWYFINGQPCPFRPHTLVLINPDEPHHLVVGQQTLLRKCCLMFMPSFFKDEMRPASPLARLPRSLQLTPADSAKVEWLLQQLSHEYAAEHPHRARMLRALMSALFVTLARAAPAAPASGADIPPSPLVDQLVDYLETHFRREVTGAELRAHFGYSADYLSGMLRRHAGCGFKRFIIERRIAEARRLLRAAPRMKITAIAQAVGFHSFPLFNRIFKRIAGMTAQAYCAR